MPLDEYRIARSGLRLLITSLTHSGKLDLSISEDALAMVDVLYEPFQRSLDPANAEYEQALPNPTIQPMSRLPDLPLIMHPDWNPVLHDRGDSPCNRPAYYLTQRIPRRQKIRLDWMRMLHSAAPPVPGKDEMVCGSCKLEINPFSPEDVNLQPHFISEEEEYRAAYTAPQASPVPTFSEPEPDVHIPPELEQQNRDSQRWTEVSKIDHLIGLARTIIHEDDLTLPEDADAGLPPDDPTPTLDQISQLPDPTPEDLRVEIMDPGDDVIFEQDEAPDLPEPELVPPAK